MAVNVTCVEADITHVKTAVVRELVTNVIELASIHQRLIFTAKSMYMYYTCMDRVLPYVI